MSVGAGSHSTVGSVPECCAPRWWRAPRWPDGRLVSPHDVGILWWVHLVVLLLAASGFWLLGQTGHPISATAPRAGPIAACMALASACCLAVSNVRRWRLAQTARSALLIGDRAVSACAAPSPMWWRVARWPDGRHVADDLIANTLAVLGLLSILAAAWVFGGSGILETGIDSRYGLLSAVLVLPASLTALVSSKRAMALSLGT